MDIPLQSNAKRRPKRYHTALASLNRVLTVKICLSKKNQQRVLVQKRKSTQTQNLKEQLASKKLKK